MILINCWVHQGKGPSLLGCCGDNRFFYTHYVLHCTGLACIICSLRQSGQYNPHAADEPAQAQRLGLPWTLRGDKTMPKLGNQGKRPDGALAMHTCSVKCVSINCQMCGDNRLPHTYHLRVRSCMLRHIRDVYTGTFRNNAGRNWQEWDFFQGFANNDKFFHPTKGRGILSICMRLSAVGSHKDTSGDNRMR